MPRELISAEHAAVTCYALAHSPDWKQELAEDWSTGSITPVLMAPAVSHGPTWLDSYSLANWPASIFKRPAQVLTSPLII